MRHVIFAGCSFTHSGDSWAYCSRPATAAPIDDGYLTLDEVDLNGVMLFSTDYDLTNFTLTNQAALHKKHYGYHDPQYESVNFIKSCKLLPVEKYRICFAGNGGASNPLISRAVIDYIDNSKTPVDTIVFQITGFARKEVLVKDKDIIEKTIKRNMNDVSVIDGVSYAKHSADLNYGIVKSENDGDIFRRHCANFYSFAAEAEDFHIKTLDHLQLLTQYCELHNIKLGYFHGWDNLPSDLSDYSMKKYKKYVLPYLITDENIFSHYNKTHPDKIHVDLEVNASGETYLGTHPNALAHRQFWNDIVEPFVR